MVVGGKAIASGSMPTERRMTIGDERVPLILVPYDRRESLTLKQAAQIAGRDPETIRRWCSLNDIGRHVGGRWAVSHPALLMLLDNDRQALRAYHAGHRSGGLVEPYFERAGMRSKKASQ